MNVTFTVVASGDKTWGGADSVRGPMTKLDPGSIVKRPNLRTERPEIWEARSACGRWLYLRQESTGTPWLVSDLYQPEHSAQWCGSLPSARRRTAGEEVMPTVEDAAVEDLVRSVLLAARLPGVVRTRTLTVETRTTAVTGVNLGAAVDAITNPHTGLPSGPPIGEHVRLRPNVHLGLLLIVTTAGGAS